MLCFSKKPTHTKNVMFFRDRVCLYVCRFLNSNITLKSLDKLPLIELGGDAKTKPTHDVLSIELFFETNVVVKPKY